MFGNLIVIFMPNFIYVFSQTSILLDSGGIFTFSGSVSVKYTLLGVLDYLFYQNRCQNRDFPILIAYWSGFGTFKKNRENPNEIGMVEQKTKKNKTKQQILLKIGK